MNKKNSFFHIGMQKRQDQDEKQYLKTYSHIPWMRVEWRKKRDTWRNKKQGGNSYKKKEEKKRQRNMGTQKEASLNMNMHDVVWEKSEGEWASGNIASRKDWKEPKFDEKPKTRPISEQDKFSIKAGCQLCHTTNFRKLCPYDLKSQILYPRFLEYRWSFRNEWEQPASRGCACCPNSVTRTCQCAADVFGNWKGLSLPSHVQRFIKLKLDFFWFPRSYWAFKNVF
jgi:hypothetical protein